MNSNFKGWMGRVRMSLMLAAIVLLVATGQRAMAQGRVWTDFKAT